MDNLQLMEQVLYYVDEHLREHITFEKLAGVFGCSSFHFHKIFSSVTGQTITDYVRKRRLMYAHKALCETDKRLTDENEKRLETDWRAKICKQCDIAFRVLLIGHYADVWD